MINLKEIVNIINPKSIIVGDDLAVKINFDKRINDVRSAAFYAFGESKITNENVLLLIDGDYLPSIYTVLTESWFQKTNLIVIALYDSIYDIETNYLNRCTVSNIKFIDKDFKQFEDKIANDLNLIGPKIINIATKKDYKEYDYSSILKILDKELLKKDVVQVFNSAPFSASFILKNIPIKYKYGIISKYVASLENCSANNILLCTKDCVEVDTNIFNHRNMNKNFKMIVIGDISKTKEWIISNNILYKEAKDLKKDINNLITTENPQILVIKEDL